MPTTPDTAPAVLEIATEDTKPLLAIVAQNGLTPEAGQNLQSSFAPFFQRARSVISQSRGIAVTDANQKLEIKMARECRLALKAIRVESDKLRKELKEESVRKGRAIDGFFNILLHLTDSEEKRLQDQEDFAERQEQARKEALKTTREKILRDMGVEPSLYQLADMDQETFTTLVEGQRLAAEAKAAAAKKAEAERVAKEAAEAAERERIRLENERLKREAAEREAAAKAEREAETKRFEEARRMADEKLKAEREAHAAAHAAQERKAAEERRMAEEKAAKERAVAEAAAKIERERAEKAHADAAALVKAERDKREKIELEIQLAKRAEALRLAQAEEARRIAAAAPDKEKVTAFVGTVRALQVPDLTTEKGKLFADKIRQQVEKFALWLEREEATNL